jgi:hypothetical protein
MKVLYITKPSENLECVDIRLITENEGIVTIQAENGYLTTWRLRRC